MGDANGDSFIDVLDLVIIVNSILSGTSLPSNCDLNGDITVDILDVVLLVSIILNN